jgi:hypothetical protein
MSILSESEPKHSSRLQCMCMYAQMLLQHTFTHTRSFTRTRATNTRPYKRTHALVQTQLPTIATTHIHSQSLIPNALTNPSIFFFQVISRCYLAKQDYDPTKGHCNNAFTLAYTNALTNTNTLQSIGYFALLPGQGAQRPYEVPWLRLRQLLLEKRRGGCGK